LNGKTGTDTQLQLQQQLRKLWLTAPAVQDQCEVAAALVQLQFTKHLMQLGLSVPFLPFKSV
jgi:hypothetical protein